MLVPTATPSAIHVCRSRLQLCLVRLRWNNADGVRIVFSDESCFQLCPDDHRRRVWRRSCSVKFLLSLLHATQVLNQELWSVVPFLLTAGTLLVVKRGTLTESGTLSNTSLASQIARFLSNRGCLEYDGKATVFTKGMLMTCLDNWSKSGKKYRRRPSGCFITLCHVLWQLASRIEEGQHLIELVT
ncbi:uncharacterized protein TNCV_5119071 [Trichonephila clavipes]|nr:uncharacterized protein TNCV_5119071 [Trichonephila clavipes]